MIKEIKLIYSDQSTNGTGTTEDPVRIIQQLWSHDGSLLFEHDSFLGKTWVNILEIEAKAKL